MLDNDAAALAALTTLLTGWGWQGTAPAMRRKRWRCRGGRISTSWTSTWTAARPDWMSRQLAAMHADVPTVVLTADRDGDLRQRLLDAGVGVLYKPLKPLALRQVLLRVVVGAARA
ncbi:hypothetical protein RLIN73S_03882 [Rhodanobacter lindaniclasticus]